MDIAFTVNGEARRVGALETASLLEVLRNHLGLMGTRYGCGLEQCGCCMVLVDGQPAYACTREVGTVAGRTVTTVEGLGTPDKPHPLQQAFLDEQAGQCGYCLSGILMSAKALLDRNPNPSRAEIVEALDKHLCRCGTHPRILRAVERAAATLRKEAGMSAPPLPASLRDNPRLDHWIAFPARPHRAASPPARSRSDRASDRAWPDRGRGTRRARSTASPCCPATPTDGPDEGYTTPAASRSRCRRLGAPGLRRGARQVARARPRSGSIAAADELSVATGSSCRTARRPARITGRSRADDRSQPAPSPARRRPKPAAPTRVVGRSVPRVDLPAKVSGAAFVHDIAAGGMLHARSCASPAAARRWRARRGSDPPRRRKAS